MDIERIWFTASHASGDQILDQLLLLLEEPGAVLLFAMLLEFMLPLPNSWRLERLSPIIKAMAAKVNLPSNTASQSYIAGFMLPLIIMGIALIALLIVRMVAGFDALLSLLVLPFLLEQRCVLTPLINIKRALDDGNKELARHILQRRLVRECDKLSVMGISKAACEFAVVRLTTTWFAVLVWYMIAGLEGAFIMLLSSIIARCLPTNLKENSSFGYCAYRIEQGLLILPVMALTCCMFLSLHPRRNYLCGLDGLHKSGLMGYLQGLLGAWGGISLGGPRYYEGELKRFPRVGGPANPDPGSALSLFRKVRICGIVFVCVCVLAEAVAMGRAL